MESIGDIKGLLKDGDMEPSVIFPYLNIQGSIRDSAKAFEDEKWECGQSNNNGDAGGDLWPITQAGMLRHDVLWNYDGVATLRQRVPQVLATAQR